MGEFGSIWRADGWGGFDRIAVTIAVPIAALKMPITRIDISRDIDDAIHANASAIR